MDWILQQFHLFIKYKKVVTKKLANMLSKPPMQKIAAMEVIMQLEPITHEMFSEDYGKDAESGDVFQAEGDNSCWSTRKSTSNSRCTTLQVVYTTGGIQLMKEAHTSRIAEYFGVGKTIENLQGYVS